MTRRRNPLTPPRYAQAFLEQLLPERDRDLILGDLAEEFRALAASRGRTTASWWYRREVVRSILPGLRRRARGGSQAASPAGIFRQFVLLEGLGADVAHGFRRIRKRPGFAVAVVCTLGLGFGANATMYGLIESVLLSPLPYEDSETLYAVMEQHRSGRVRVPSYPTFEDWAEEADWLQDLAFVRGAPLVYRFRESTGLLLGSFVTERFFPMLGHDTFIGRVLTADDHTPGAERAVVVSHRAWQRWFGGDPQVVGRSVILDELSFTIVGVLPPSFAYPDWGANNDLWMPMSALPPGEWNALNQRDFHADSRVLARVPEDVALSAIRRRMDRLAESLSVRFPESAAGWTAVVLTSLKELEVRNARPRLLMLGIAVALVLLICCLNLANLFLVHADSRRGEYALRTALGATRTRVFRQILTETLVLVGAGGLLALWLTKLGVRWAASGGLGDLPRIGELTLDWPVFLFTGGLCVMVSTLLTLIAGRRAGSGSLRGHLHSAQRGVTPSGLREWIQSAQIGGAFLLLVGAWLLAENLLRLSRVEPGFDPQELVVVPVNPPSPTYDDERAALALYESLLRSVATVPGVQSVALTNHGPGGRAGAPAPAALGGAPNGSDDDIQILYRTVSAGYFDTLGTELVSGREFTESDLAGPEGLVIVNQTLASRWGGKSPLGRTMGVRKAASTRADFGEVLLGRVIGVVADLDPSETGGSTVPTVYVPYTHSPWAQARLLVRTDRATNDLLLEIEDAIRSVEPALPLSGPFVGPQRMEDVRAEQRSDERLNTWLVSAFAVMALVLASIGVYGVVSYAVAQKTRAIGVRMAVGASPGRVVLEILSRTARMTMVGLLIGALAAIGVSRFATQFPLGIESGDAGVYISGAAVLLLVVLGAAVSPARKAGAVDAAEVLRST